MENSEEKARRVVTEIQAILEREKMAMIPSIQLVPIPEEATPSPFIIPSDR